MVTVLDLTERLVPLKKVANVEGGEWVGPCPFCKAGTNRFHVWPFHSKSATGRYWCRQCNRSGDAIQFLRDFEGMDFKQAYQAVTGQSPSFAGSNTGKRNSGSTGSKLHSQRPYQPQNYSLPSRKWLDQASDLVGKAHQTLLEYRPGLEYLRNRGFALDFIKSQRFGWILEDKFYNLKKWGLSGPRPKRVWVPVGLVIPMWQCLYDSPFPDAIKI